MSNVLKSNNSMKMTLMLRDFVVSCVKEAKEAFAGDKNTALHLLARLIAIAYKRVQVS